MTDEEREKRRLYQKNWRDANKDRMKRHYAKQNARNKGSTAVWSADQRKRNGERHTAYMRRYRAELREADPEYFRRAQIKHKYDLTSDDFETMWTEQSGCCAICQASLTRDRKTHIDHSHKTGLVRGLLCRNCNLLLGNAHDDETTLNSAIAYLTKHRTYLNLPTCSIHAARSCSSAHPTPANPSIQRSLTRAHPASASHCLEAWRVISPSALARPTGLSAGRLS